MGITDICIFDNVSYYLESSNRKERRGRRTRQRKGKTERKRKKKGWGKMNRKRNRIKMTGNLVCYQNVAVNCT
jgi:hypothetical protein